MYPEPLALTDSADTGPTLPGIPRRGTAAHIGPRAESRRRATVLIIGAGLAGAATAIRLLRYACSPMDILLLEKKPAHRCAGIAYYAEGNSWRHIFNIQAGRMSIFREDVDDFLRWANEEADRSEWPEAWATVTFRESDPAPRRIYQDYMRERLAAAANEAAPGVRLRQPNGEAVAIDERGRSAWVTVRNYQPRTGARVQTERVIRADQVVIATGTEMKVHPFARHVLDHPAYVDNQYTAHGLARLRRLPPDATVAIIGSILTAYDTVTELIGNGHRGKIRMISRSGITLNTYPERHQHGVIEVERPTFLDQPYTGKEALIRAVLAEWQQVQAAARHAHPEIDEAILSERIIKAWEPYIPELAARMPAADVRALLARYGSLIATQRVSAMAYTTRIIEESMKGPAPQVELCIGRVTDIQPVDGDRLTVHFQDGDCDGALAADLVVSNLPRETDYARVLSPLWRNLIHEQGLAAPHRITGKGVEVGPQGELKRADGTLSSLLWVAGIPREGDEMVRNGRTGAFAFNVATIKNHSVSVAAHLLHRLEARRHPAPEEAGDSESLRKRLAGYVAGDHLGEWMEEIERLIDCRVRFLALTTREEREAAQQEEARIMHGLASLPLHKAAARAEVIQCICAFAHAQAVTRMADVSVTPGQLRVQLGLGAPRYVGV